MDRIELRYSVLTSNEKGQNAPMYFAKREDAIEFAKGLHPFNHPVVCEDTVLASEGNKLLDRETIWDQLDLDAEVADPFDQEFPEEKIEPDFEAMREALEDGEDEVECQLCFELFPKEDCVKVPGGYVCRKCHEATVEHPEEGETDPFSLEFDLPEEDETFQDKIEDKSNPDVKELDDSHLLVSGETAEKAAEQGIDPETGLVHEPGEGEPIKDMGEFEIVMEKTDSDDSSDDSDDVEIDPELEGDVAIDGLPALQAALFGGDRGVADAFLELDKINEDLKITIGFGSYEPWSGAVPTYNAIADAGKLDELEAYLEELFPDGLTETQLNDVLWFDGDKVLEDLGLKETEEARESLNSPKGTQEAFEKELERAKIKFMKIGKLTYSGIEKQFDKIAEIAKKVGVGVEFSDDSSGYFRISFSALESLTESQAQEISGIYAKLKRRYGVDVEDLMYGEGGFMKTNYPNGFPDFAGDALFSQKYWGEFEKWCKEARGIELKENIKESFTEPHYTIETLRDALAGGAEVELGYTTDDTDVFGFDDGGVYADTKYSVSMTEDGKYEVFYLYESDDGGEGGGDSEIYNTYEDFVSWLKGAHLEDCSVLLAGDLNEAIDLKEAQKTNKFAEAAKSLAKKAAKEWDKVILDNPKFYQKIKDDRETLIGNSKPFLKKFPDEFNKILNAADNFDLQEIKEVLEDAGYDMRDVFDGSVTKDDKARINDAAFWYLDELMWDYTDLSLNGYRLVLADYADPDSDEEYTDVEYLLKPGQTKGDLAAALSDAGYTLIYLHGLFPATEKDIKRANFIGFETVKGKPGDKEALKEAKKPGDREKSYNAGLMLAKVKDKPVIYGYSNKTLGGKFFALDDPIVCDKGEKECAKDFKSQYKNCGQVCVAYPDKDLTEGLCEGFEVGDEVKIIRMDGEPEYSGRTGKIEHIDGIGQLHGTWGGCALIPGIDEFELIEKESLTEDAVEKKPIELPDDFGELMDFLAKDEEEAISAYEAAADKLEGNAKDAVEHIKGEEEAHRDYLEKAKEDPDLEYEHPEESHKDGDSEN